MAKRMNRQTAVQTPKTERALLLAAGMGLRLRPLTERIPKCLVPVGGVPLLDRWEAMLEAAGVGTVIVNLHARAADVRGHIEQYRGRSRILWRCDEEPVLLGTAGATRRHLQSLEQSDHFLIIYADNYSCVDLAAFMHAHKASDAELTMALFEPPDATGYGIVTLDRNGVVTGFEEKPQTPRGKLANAGLYAVKRGVFGPYLDDACVDLAEHVLPRLVGRMRGWIVDCYHRDIGTPERLAAVERDIAAAGFAGLPDGSAVHRVPLAG